jgi:hypothetical protein
MAAAPGQPEPDSNIFNPFCTPLYPVPIPCSSPDPPPSDSDFARYLLRRSDQDDNTSQLIAVLLGLRSLVVQQKTELAEYRIVEESHIGQIMKICEFLYSPTFRVPISLRATAVQHIKFHRKVIKRCQAVIAIYEKNIQTIDAFVTFVMSLPGCDGVVDLDRFLMEDVIQPEFAWAEIQRCNTVLRPLDLQKLPPFCEFMNPLSTAGRIILDFLRNIPRLTYSQVRSMFDPFPASLRTLLFDLAWQQVKYPFVKSPRGLTLPRIFDLSISVLDPVFLPERMGRMTFAQVGGKRSPFKHAINSLFLMLVLTDPFVIADCFWDFIQQLGILVQALAVGSGLDPVDVEVGFDQIFPYLTICVIGFGIDEILDVMSFTGAFLKDAAGMGTTEFAMSHCLGLLSHIRGLDAKELRLATQGRGDSGCHHPACS